MQGKRSSLPFMYIHFSAINECESDPCQHGATCRDFVDEYNCTCVQGYNGTHCENGKNPCFFFRT